MNSPGLFGKLSMFTKEKRKSPKDFSLSVFQKNTLMRVNELLGFDRNLTNAF